MKNDSVSYLLKFTTFDLNTIYNIMNRQIFFNDPEEFNDPLDIEFPLKNLNETIEIKISNDNGVTCFTGLKEVEEIIYNNDNIVNQKIANKKYIAEIDEIFNRLLWSHYADMHRGICLIYKTNSDFIDNNFEKGFVDYKDSLIINTKKMIENAYFFTKHSHWKYENEYRILCKNKKILINEKELGIKLDAIIFGLRAFNKLEEKDNMKNNNSNKLKLIEILLNSPNFNEKITLDAKGNTNNNTISPLLFYIKTNPNNNNNELDLLKLDIENIENL